MEVRNLRCVEVQTTRYEAMVGFLRDLLGLRVNFEEPTSVEFSTSEGDQVQMMAPGDPYFDFFERHASGRSRCSRSTTSAPRPGSWRRPASRSSGRPGVTPAGEWVHFRAPDGHLYELASRRPT